MSQPPLFSSQTYLLEDLPRTLFPLSTSRLVATNGLPELQAYIADILKDDSTDAFLPQQRCYASKSGYHVRRTAVLDPVAGSSRQMRNCHW